MDIKKTVEHLSKKFYTYNPHTIAKGLNINIIHADLGGRKYGYYMKYKRSKIILIDSNKCGNMENFIFAHELGHAVCTPDENTAWLKNHTFGNLSRAERMANEFAVELLLPDDYLIENSDYAIQTLANKLHIPIGLLYLKRV